MGVGGGEGTLQQTLSPSHSESFKRLQSSVGRVVISSLVKWLQLVAKSEKKVRKCSFALKPT